ncbi:hypothetical protein SAMN06295879_2426 [Agreia bicolorata]|uniref:Uncharacterized protein n=1 Tax=Agreia bicolorata TaxID=110935 RepID=A0A1T4Y7C3_9MICO|nr:hypothetical protein [Agreia bicolorata]SKA97697.1 hypothetical protein SAMN06295879_2426 [Agreia bicolorata]
MTEKRRTPSMCRHRRSIAAAALAALLALTASGCSLLIPPPPDSVSSAVDQAVTELRSTEGVASVTSKITSYDPMDDGTPSSATAWYATISVEAQPDATDLPGLADTVAHRIDEVNKLVPVNAELHLSVGAHEVGTTVSLTFADGSSDSTPASQLVATAEQVASIDSVSSIELGRLHNPPSIGVASSADVPAAATAIRQLPTFGVGDLTSVVVLYSASDEAHNTTRVTMDAASPSPEVLTLIGSLVEEPGVASVFFTGVQPPDGAPVVTDAAGWRPALSVAVGDEQTQAAVASALEAFADPQALDATMPRSSFDVTLYPQQMARVKVDGFVGLPAGSPAPDDGRKPPPPPAPAPPPAAPAPTPETPDEQAARVANDQVAIAQLLDAAGDIAGIRGTPTIQTIACQAEGIDSGLQVTGSVVIPIFKVAKTADAAYAAITNSWKAAGMSPAGGAMGRAAFGAASTTMPVQQTTIRGTTDGLSITAQGRC